MKVVVTVIGLCAAVALGAAQQLRGQAVPESEQSGPIEFVDLRFLTFTFGREGPMDVPLRGAPVRGREYFVEADVSGVESAASIRFDVVDAAGRPIQPLTMWKATDGASDGEFHGLATVPTQPFRVLASGTMRGGTSFRTFSDAIVRPVDSGPPDDVVMVPGLSVDQMRQVNEMVAEYRQQWRERALRAAADQPNRTIALKPPSVSSIAYEPLTSASAAPIGIRLSYTIRFQARSTIVGVPHVFPRYRAMAMRGVVGMSPLTGSVTPAPVLVGGQSPTDVIRYAAAATYEAGVTYTFVVDFVPDYVIQGQSGRFCLYLQKFSDRRAFDALIADEAAMPYSISIADTATNATIPTFFAQRTFYQSFIKGAAPDCGPTPTVRF